ncbi:MAG: cysteine--tRNA ligase [Oscillospiraceae bacterium]|nr:cysteine--tRNA ligase [Oscillospiraceae bacterium]
MKIYNTMSGNKEDFVPSGAEATIYSCGPTVYNFAHIGNLRTYLFMDWLRRVLKLNNFGIKHVMNITDVGHLVSDEDEGEDKMAKTARETKKTPYEIAAFYTEAFLKDIDALSVERPELIPKATDHILEMLEIVEGLYEKGYGYEITDGIYFDISKFPEYGKLSRVNLEKLQAGARVETNEEKRHPADFALWKKAPPEHIMQWPSRWGQGYPGWHIECSAMSRKYLGDTFDIHTGGVDHIPIHHENEIAQSEAFTGKNPARFWMHAEFMLVDGGKMSKSLQNTYTVSDLKEKGYAPEHFRYFCANAHYRSKCNFTWKGMDDAKTSYNRLTAALETHKSAANSASGAAFAKEARERFIEAVSDDLNIPKGLGIIWEAARYPEKCRELYDFILSCDAVMGLNLANPPKDNEESIEPSAQALIDARQEARAAKNWAESDRLRDELKAMGIAVEDTPQGQKWKKL